MYECKSQADCVGKIGAYELSKVRWTELIVRARTGVFPAWKPTEAQQRKLRWEYVKFWHDDDKVVRDTYKILDDMCAYSST